MFTGEAPNERHLGIRRDPFVTKVRRAQDRCQHAPAWMISPCAVPDDLCCRPSNEGRDKAAIGRRILIFLQMIIVASSHCAERSLCFGSWAPPQERERFTARRISSGASTFWFGSELTFHLRPSNGLEAACKCQLLLLASWASIFTSSDCLRGFN